MDRSRWIGCTFEPLESRQLMAAGALDPSFGIGGKFSLRFGLDDKVPYTLFAQDAVVQPDGKTVIAAKFDEVHAFGDFRSDFALVRLNFDGTLDTSFGTSDHPGIAIQHFGKDENVRVGRLALQTDGKIVMTGSAIRERRFREDLLDMVVARFTPTGKLDNSFAGDGARFIEFTGSIANDLAIQKDGKIVVVGEKFTGTLSLSLDTDFAIARLNSDGSMDKSFDGDGMKTIGFGEDDNATGVAIDGSGRIVIVGSDGEFEHEQIVVKRLNSNGSSDSSFGTAGTVKTKFDRFDFLKGQDVVIQGSGKIVVLAQGDSDGRPEFANRQFVLVRYNANGTTDSSFGDNGQGFVETGFGGFESPSEIIQSPLGGLIAAGSTDGKFALASYNVDGALNTSFGNGGRVITDFPADGTASDVGIGYGPGRRITMVGGDVLKTARYLDTGANTVSVVAVNPPTDLQAAETVPGQKKQVASFIVDRNEALPFPTRVFFNISGTAINNVDYTTNLKPVLRVRPGLSIIDIATGEVTVTPDAPSPGQAFIDIPAGQSSATITLTPKDDKLFEVTETASFSVVPNDKYEVSSLNSITANIADNNDPILINFQTPGAVPQEYVADVGQVFGDRGNGLTYGWNADNTGNMRRRNNPRSPDERFDTLALTQAGGNRKWEIALPNGMYSVQLDPGDPDFTDSVYKFNLENRFAISGVPGGETRWFERSFNIEVKDGRLTLSNNSGAVNNKIAFINITRAQPGAVEGPTTGNLPVNLEPPPVIPVKPVTAGAVRIFSQVLI